MIFNQETWYSVMIWRSGFILSASSKVPTGMTIMSGSPWYRATGIVGFGLQVVKYLFYIDHKVIKRMVFILDNSACIIRSSAILLARSYL